MKREIAVGVGLVALLALLQSSQIVFASIHRATIWYPYITLPIQSQFNAQKLSPFDVVCVFEANANEGFYDTWFEHPIFDTTTCLFYWSLNKTWLCTRTLGTQTKVRLTWVWAPKSNSFGCQEFICEAWNAYYNASGNYGITAMLIFHRHWKGLSTYDVYYTNYPNWTFMGLMPIDAIHWITVTMDVDYTVPSISSLFVYTSAYSAAMIYGYNLPIAPEPIGSLPPEGEFWQFQFWGGYFVTDHEVQVYIKSMSASKL